LIASANAVHFNPAAAFSPAIEARGALAAKARHRLKNAALRWHGIRRDQSTFSPFPVSPSLENALWCGTISPLVVSIINYYQRLGGEPRLWRTA
jgi:hypothetical protein